MPNKLENSLPQAAKPDAVYGIKKITIISAEIASRVWLLSRYRFEKKSGMVIAFPAAAE